MLKHLLAQNSDLYVNVTQISLYLAQMAYAISAHVKNSKTSVVKSTRNELIKLPVFSIKCKAMMGICIYWISSYSLYLEKGANTAQLSKIEEWVIFYN